MEPNSSVFDLGYTIQELKKYLPTQGPLKDYIFLNSLACFQDLPFHEAMKRSSEIFGYKTYLDLKEYRKLYNKGHIRPEILKKVIIDQKGVENFEAWEHKLLEQEYQIRILSRVGKLRSAWKKFLKIDVDNFVHLNLFRIVGAYLDQGISIWNFPVNKQGLRNSLIELEKNSFTSFFKTDRAKQLLANRSVGIKELLDLLVGKEELYFQYLFDQQFEHQGWSGMVTYLEKNPHVLLDKRAITMEDFIFLELLLEIDTLDDRYAGKWTALGLLSKNGGKDIFAPTRDVEITEVLKLWQEAYEWSYYDDVLFYLAKQEPEAAIEKPTFQSLFCIDDRECSFRTYVEQMDPQAETYGTAGFFNIEFYYKPDGGKYLTKLCPAPVTPNYIILEKAHKYKQKKEVGFSSKSHGLIIGWLLTQTMGYWSAFKLLKYIFKPSYGNTTVSSFQHMSPTSSLIFENKEDNQKEHDLTVGFTTSEMADRIEGLLRSIGLISNFADLIYVIGHGSTSANNAFYSTMDCGACSCKPGSVNARLAALMGNHPEVRKILAERGLNIPETTQFIGGLHDTAQDLMVYYDLVNLSDANKANHLRNQAVFDKALLLNAKERSRRFMSVDSTQSLEKIHKDVQTRSFSLFEPRPELDHATNSLCVVGGRWLTKNVFLDRRAFLNSYNYKQDLKGEFLLNILKAVTPVCGGINLAYYFAKVDDQKFGSGSKLPHNIVGLFGVANGIEGDIRPGLPKQMVEVHDPMRLMCIVEHYPDVVQSVLSTVPATFEWYQNDWIKLVVIHPDTRELYLFEKDSFALYSPHHTSFKSTPDLQQLVESTHTNIPVHQIINS
jgi:uncharacterized protein YbcC (UPF0753/DUF2309 family)